MHKERLKDGDANEKVFNEGQEGQCKLPAAAGFADEATGVALQLQ